MSEVVAWIAIIALVIMWVAVIVAWGYYWVVMASELHKDFEKRVRRLMKRGARFQ